MLNNKFPAHKWISGSEGFIFTYFYKSTNAEFLSPIKWKHLALFKYAFEKLLSKFIAIEKSFIAYFLQFIQA